MFRAMLLTKTSELAIHSLLYLAQKPEGYVVNPKEIAKQLDESQTYISKVLRSLAQGGLIKSHRGAAGGFTLLRPAMQITLLDVIEISQGTIPGNYCGRASEDSLSKTCGYHQAMHDLRDSTRSALARWTIGTILETPRPKFPVPNCMMRRVALD